MAYAWDGMAGCPPATKYLTHRKCSGLVFHKRWDPAGAGPVTVKVPHLSDCHCSLNFQKKILFPCCAHFCRIWVGVGFCDCCWSHDLYFVLSTGPIGMVKIYCSVLLSPHPAVVFFCKKTLNCFQNHKWTHLVLSVQYPVRLFFTWTLKVMFIST